MRYTLALATFLCLITGCSPTWFQDFKNNPVQQTDMVLNSAASVAQVATVVFNQLKPLLPADKQGHYEALFNGSQVALNKAMDAVRTAVKAAAEAQEPKPDLSKVLADVYTAVNQVKAVVVEVRDLLKTPPVAATPGATTATPMLIQDPIGYDEMNGMADSFKAN